MQVGARQLNEMILPGFTGKFAKKSAAATLAVYEQVVHCDTSDAGFTLTMPNVSEAKGRTYTIDLVAGETSAVTLTAVGSRDWTGDFTLDADDDRITLYSDGERWVVVHNEIA